MFQTRTSRSQPPVTRLSSQGTMAHTPITWPWRHLRCLPSVSKTKILALSRATMMYLSVRCNPVTTAWSGVICLCSTLPPTRQAVSTWYFCLKWLRYVIAFGRVRLPGAGDARSNDLERASSGLEEENAVVDVIKPIAAPEAAPFDAEERSGLKAGLRCEDPASSDPLLYACFSHNDFQAMSSLTNSCHRRETCEERARVFASSIKVNICKCLSAVSTLFKEADRLPSNTAHSAGLQTDLS